MAWKTGLAALAIVSATPALAVEVTRTAEIEAAPAAAWAAVGDFCGIGTWHPAVESCTLSEDDMVRTLALVGGGTIVERQTGRDDAAMQYGYAILESPLPVANYESTISVAPNGSGSLLTWTGQFDAKDATDEEAAGVIAGIYEAGLKGIAEAAAK